MFLKGGNNMDRRIFRSFVAMVDLRDAKYFAYEN